MTVKRLLSASSTILDSISTVFQAQNSSFYAQLQSSSYQILLSDIDYFASSYFSLETLASTEVIMKS